MHRCAVVGHELARGHSCDIDGSHCNGWRGGGLDCSQIFLVSNHQYLSACATIRADTYRAASSARKQRKTVGRSCGQVGVLKYVIKIGQSSRGLWGRECAGDDERADGEQRSSEMIKGCGQSAWGCGETGSVDLVNRTSTNTAVADTVTGSLAQSHISRWCCSDGYKSTNLLSLLHKASF
jgi:hypothetical protein